jgi:hypothetical protein
MSTELIEAAETVSSVNQEATAATEGIEQPVSQPSLDERISIATVSNYQEVLGEIAEIEDSIIQDSYLTKLAKNLYISRKLLDKELLKKIAASTGLADDGEILGTKMAVFPGLVDLVKNEEGKIRYLIKQEDGLHLAESWTDSDGYICIPPEQKNIQFQLPDAARVMSFSDDTDDNRIYEDLQVFFRRFSYLEDEVWPIIILSVFLSYIQDHHDVRYIPGIYFYATAERGKSRTAKTMLATSYRGIHLADIRTANVVRFSERLNATLFFDVTDLWKSAEKGDSCDILLGRFEKGTKVARVLNPDKGPFDDQTYFSVYGSSIFATNEPANSIFESRCLSITMPNKPGNYENLSPEMGLPFKDRLTAWRARMMDKHLPHVEPIPGVGGRLWDISQPLFQLAMLIAPDAFEMIKKVVLEMAGQKVENKRDTLEGQLVDAIDNLVDRQAPEPWEVPVEAVRSRVNSSIANMQYHHSPQKIGRRVQSLSIETRKINGTSRVFITARELDVLKEQHGMLVGAASGETLPLSTIRQDAPTTGPYTGRESGESQELANGSPERKPLDFPSDRKEVESGSELPAPPSDKDDEHHKAYLNLINGTEEHEVTEPAGKDPERERKVVIDFNKILAQKAKLAEGTPVEERPKVTMKFGKP